MIAAMRAVLLLLIVSGYLGLAGLLIRQARSGVAAPAPWLGLLVLTALGAHFASLWHIDPTLGFNFGFWNSLSTVAFLMALVASAGLGQARWRILALLSYLTALLTVVFAQFGEHRHGHGTTWQIEFHAAIALLAYSVLSLAALQALIVAAAEHGLRRHRGFRLLTALPPLSAMESLLFQLIGVGFALLTLTLLSGLLFIHDWMAQHLVHKTVLTVVSWLVFGVLLFGRWRFGWRGRQALRWTLSGMLVLLLAFFGSKFVLELILRRVP